MARIYGKSQCSGARCSHTQKYKGGHCDVPACYNNVIDCPVPSHWETLPSYDDGTGY